MKIKKAEILRLMNDIMERMPLCLEFNDDGRNVWPARWNELYNQIENYPNGTTKKTQPTNP